LTQEVVLLFLNNTGIKLPQLAGNIYYQSTIGGNSAATTLMNKIALSEGYFAMI